MRDRFLLEHGREEGGGLTCGASAAEREGMGPARQPEKEKGGVGSARFGPTPGPRRGGKENRPRGGGLAGPPAAAALASFFPFYFSKAFFEREF